MATARQTGPKGTPRSRSGDKLDSGAEIDRREIAERAREVRSRKAARRAMPPLSREHLVIGPFSLTGRRLTFQTVNVLLVQNARETMATHTDFTVNLCPPEGMTTVTGRVTNVGIVSDGQLPQRWDVAMLIRQD